MNILIINLAPTLNYMRLRAHIQSTHTRKRTHACTCIYLYKYKCSMYNSNTLTLSMHFLAYSTDFE